MNMGWLRFCCVCGIVAGSVGTPLALWRHASALEAERSRQSHALAEEWTALSNENQRLSNLVARVNGSELAPAKLAELLKLRGEIGLLRESLIEATNLAARNLELAGTLTNAQMPAGASSLPEGQRVVAHWPREQLGFAGYADPAAALESTLWAMAQGDTNALLNSVTPDVRPKLLRQDWNQHGTPEEELAASARKINDSLQPAKGFYLLGVRSVSPDQAVLDVFFDGEGRTRKFLMKNVGGEWKFNALGRAGAADADVHAAFSAWP